MASNIIDWCAEQPLSSSPAPLATLCSEGHHAAFLLFTSQGGQICLACFSDLLSQPSAFVIHKAYALSELIQALEDDGFCRSLLQHRHFLVAPLSEALYICSDEGLADAIMQTIQNLCRLASGDTILLNDFIANLSLQLASQLLVWSCGQRFVLHSLGTLIDLYGKYEDRLPDVLRAHDFFLPNLLSGLRLPADCIRGEILFVLYKISSLQEGIDELLRYCPQCVHLALNALLKTEDDELRTNCIAFLIIMARSSVFDIGLVLDDEIPFKEIFETAVTAPSTISFAKLFSEAIKGSLMSTDIQVQASSIQLICHVCSVPADVQNEIRTLVDAGIVEYIFEILRVSEDILKIANVAIGALVILSTAGDSFTQRLVFGVEAVIRVLESFIEPNWMVQKEAMLLFAANISDIPGLLTAARVETLFLLIEKLLKQHVSLVDLEAHGDGVHLYPETFSAACSALIALLKVPCCYSMITVPHVLLSCAMIATEVAKNCRLATEHSILQSSVRVLQEASSFSQRAAESDSSYCSLSLSLLNSFEHELLPIISNFFESLEEEETALAIIETCLHFLQASDPSRAMILAETLASRSWCSLLFQCMNRFPSEILKQSAYGVLSAIIENLGGKELGKLVKAASASRSLPRDPIDLLTLIEQTSSPNSDLMIAQYAIFAIIYTSHLYNDRLAHEYQILASLDHYILINGSTLWRNSPFPAGFRLFVFLYAFLKEILDKDTQPNSNEAGKVLLETIKQSHGIEFISSETPKPVLRWFLCNDPLQSLVMEQLLSWFTVAPSQVSQELVTFKNQVEGRSSYLQEWKVLSDLAAENGCIMKLLVLLFDKLGELLIDKETEITAFVYFQLIHSSPSIAAAFHQNGLVYSIRWWILKHGSRAFASTLTSVFQLLFILLQTMMLRDLEAGGDCWHDIANQAMNLLMRTETVKLNSSMQASSIVCVMCLIINTSLDSDILAEASRALCFNKDLLRTLWSNVINEIKNPTRLSNLSLVNPEEEIICLSLVFHMLWLRLGLKSKRDEELIGFGDSFEESLLANEEVATPGTCKSLVTVKHLCQVLNHGSRPLKILASSCLVHVFSQLAEHTSSVSYQKVDLLDVSISFIKSTLLVLQASALHECPLVSKNSSFCLYWLISTKRLKNDIRSVVERSPWSCFLMQDLMRLLSAASQCPVIGAPSAFSTQCVGLITIALSLLKLTPALDWVHSVFSPQNVSAVIDNLSSQAVTHWHVCFFMELLQARHLQKEHVEKLRMLFQACRKTVYKSLTLTDKKLPFLFGQVEQSDIATSSPCLQMILKISLEQFMRCFATRKDLSRDANKNAISEADVCIGNIDDFLQCSLQFQ